jgi:hypothetical protein
MAKAVADSRMFGVESQAQALVLMLLCQAEGLPPIMALRRYRIIDGEPSFRADALQGEFEKDGAILWHQRDEKMCAATFFRKKAQVDAEAVIRAKDRFKRLKANQDATDLAQVDEITILRTIEDAIEKRVAMRWDRTASKWVIKHSWQQSPRQMLHARCLTEGVRAINPGLVAGVYIEDEILDIPAAETKGMDQRPPAEVIERNVRQATANAVAADNDEIPGVPSSSSPARSSLGEGGSPSSPASDPGLRPVGGSAPEGDGSPSTGKLDLSPFPVTRDNYKELVVHIGKAEGEMLGKKVGELHPKVLEWLYTKWRDKLSPLSNDADLRLKTAVEFAYEAQRAAPPPASEDETPAVVSAQQPELERHPVEAGVSPAVVADGSAPSPISLRAVGSSEPEAHLPSAIPSTKDEFIAELRDRCKDLIITEEQACGYLRREGVFEKEEHFADASTKLLGLLLRPDMWSTLKDVVEADVKPKVVEKSKAKKSGRRKAED